MRASITTLLLLLAFAATWFFWPTGDEPVPDPGAGAGRSGQPATAGPASSSSASAVPAGTPRVELRWTVLQGLAPPLADDRLAVTRGGRVTPETLVIVAGNGTGLLARDERDGRALVAIDTHDRRRLHRIVAYDPNVPLTVELGTPVPVHGHVIDDQGAPIAGARVHACEGRDGGFDAATTDAAGAFTLPVTAGVGVPLVASASGRADGHLVIDALGDVADLTMTLAPEAVVEVQLQAHARELEAAQVFVVPTAEPTTELLRYPAFLSALRGGVPTDALGRCVLHGLPRGSTVGLVVQHPLAALAAPVTVILQQATTTASLPLELLPELTGRVVDPAGAPLAHALVVARAAGRGVRAGAAARRLMPALLDAEGCAVAVCDVDGRFRVGRVGRGACALAIRSFDLAGVDLALADGQAPGDVAVPRWVPSPHLLRVTPPVADQAWGIRVGSAAELVPVAANEAFVVPFDQPAVVQVRVVVERDGVRQAERVFDRIVVMGTTELPR